MRNILWRVFRPVATGLAARQKQLLDRLADMSKEQVAWDFITLDLAITGLKLEIIFALCGAQLDD